MLRAEWPYRSRKFQFGRYLGQVGRLNVGAILLLPLASRRASDAPGTTTIWRQDRVSVAGARDNPLDEFCIRLTRCRLDLPEYRAGICTILSVAGRAAEGRP